jgi:hypothetical protein
MGDWLLLVEAPPLWATACLFALAAALLVYLVTPKEQPVTVRTILGQLAAAARKVAAFIATEPAVALAVAGAVADAFAQAQADGLDAFSAVRAAVIVGVGVLVRSRVTPTRKLPPPPPPGS